MSIADKWGWIVDDNATGTFDTPEEAAEDRAEYLCEEGQVEAGEVIEVEVGQYREPRRPEELLHMSPCCIAGDICDNYDDYSGEWAENWLKDYTSEQEAELAAAFRSAFATWLDRHNLRPTWGIVDTTRRIEVTVVGEE